MPTRAFQIWLAETAQCVIAFVTDKGNVVGFVVRLRAQVAGRWYDIRRYDTAHGQPHIDVLNWRGETVEKIWLPHYNIDDALTFAQRDVQLNYQTYIQGFLR